MLHALSVRPRRFKELQRLSPGISHKVLTETVRHLEAHGLIDRSVGPGPAPCVEYALSERGASVRPILAAVVDWGNARLAEGAIARRATRR